MADLIQIQTTGTTIDLNSGSTTAITTEDFLPPAVVNQAVRVSGFPFVAGSRTTAAALADTEATWVGHIRGTSVNNIEAQYQALVTLLGKAILWETQRIGAPVRLAYKRQGATNTAYWVVKGVTFPDAASTGQQMAVETATMLRIRLTLILEPVAHAGALTALINAQAVTNVPVSNIETSGSAVGGTMDAPLSIMLANTSGTAWSEVWLAEIGAAANVYNLNTNPDATSYGGSGGATLNGTAQSVADVSWSAVDNLPVRALFRCKVTAGTNNLVQLQFRLHAGSIFGVIDSTPWISFPGVGTNWTLVDLGSLRVPELLRHRTNQGGAVTVKAVAYAKTSDGSAATLGIDYLEVISYRSFVKVTGTIANAQMVMYDMVARDGTFYWPSTRPQTYLIADPGILVSDAVRRGTFQSLLPSSTPIFWFAAHTTTGHDIAHTGTLDVDYIKMYALGLRGNA